MPIPQLKNRKDQFWRNGQKKYYISRRPQASANHGSYKNGRGFNLFQNFRKKLIFGALILTGLAVIVGVVGFLWLSKDLPDPNHLITRQVAQSTKIYDRTGQTVLYEISGDQKRTLVNLIQIPDYVKWATISIEDKDFYKHGGFSIWAIFRTVVTDILFRRSAGASTLTQQLIKNAILTNEKTFIRKAKELIMAYRLEQRFSKDEILQMYFNEIPYGSTAYGIEAASQRYFGKNVQDINLAEAAILAALPQSPSRYSPYGPNRDLLIGRQQYILDLMVKYGYVSKEDAQAAKDFPLKFAPPVNNIQAPHFVMYVKELLSEKYGEKEVEQGGYRIITTLDLYKQKIAEDTISEIAPKNEKNYQATNAALVSIDPKTGQILAMVGSRDYFNEDIDGQVNITTSSRQPGSSMKPIVYAAAFIKGYTPNTMLYDVVTNFSTDPANPYEPHNYDSKEHGLVTMRQALAGSLNIPAVKTIYLAGINNVLDLAQELGYTTLNDRSRFGLSLVLGGGEVKLLEHANAYSAFAREGFLHPTSAILRVEDKNGKILEDFTPQEKQVLNPNVAREINGILSDNSARAFIFGEKNYLTLPNRPVAAKTGTTNDYHDAWTIGYTPSLVTGVWVGNSDNKAMKKGADGSMVAAPIWNAYMKKVLGDTPVETFKPADIPVTGKPVLDGQSDLAKMVNIDRSTGLLATANTPASFIVAKPFADPHCILYYINKDDPLGPAPTDPTADPQFALWESRVLAWAAKQGYATSSPPTATDNVHLAENQPQLDITAPVNNDTLTSPLLYASVNATAPRGINRLEYYINDNLLAINYSYPFNLAKTVNFLPNGFYNLKARACDDVDNCTTKGLEFNLNLADNIINQNLNFSLLEPTNGLAANHIDFPLRLQLSLDNPIIVAKVNFYYQTGTSTNSTLINTVQPIESNIVNSTWDNIPPSGAYKVYAEIITWNKKAMTTAPVKIMVTNPPPVTSATSTKPIR